MALYSYGPRKLGRSRVVANGLDSRMPAALFLESSSRRGARTPHRTARGIPIGPSTYCRPTSPGTPISTCHNYMGHNCIGHDYRGHNHMGHSYTCHNYIGHNCIGHSLPSHVARASVFAVHMPMLRTMPSVRCPMHTALHMPPSVQRPAYRAPETLSNIYYPTYTSLHTLACRYCPTCTSLKILRCTYKYIAPHILP